MKNWIYILMIGLMGSLVSSCRQSLDDELQTSKDAPRAANISMRLVLDESFSASRGTWGKNEDESHEFGNSFENEIDLNDPDALQVIVQVYNAENSMIEELEVIDKSIVRLNTENGRIYTLDGILNLQDTNIEHGDYSCRIMVFVNCGADLEVYSCQGNGYIPMWGVLTTNLNLAYDANNQIDDIYLLRAMAKIEVMLHPDIAENFDLSSVVVDKYNTTGNVLPNGYADVADTRHLNQQDVFHPNDTSAGTDLSFIQETDQEKFYVYMPEYQNVDVDTPANIHLVIDGKSYIIRFKHYVGGQATGDPYNIVRNHYYKYIITSVSKETIEVNLTLQYEVEDWTEVINPGLSFE